jgi:hypothetical protein
MNGEQLAHFAKSVGEESLARLSSATDRCLSFESLVSDLARATFMDPSEIAFGVTLAASTYGLLHVEMAESGRRVRPGYAAEAR